MIKTNNNNNNNNDNDNNTNIFFHLLPATRTCDQTVSVSQPKHETVLSSVFT